MLVNHTDTVVDGLARVIDGNLAAVNFDPALIRLIKAEKNVHQGCLSGAVFT